MDYDYNGWPALSCRTCEINDTHTHTQLFGPVHISNILWCVLVKHNRKDMKNVRRDFFIIIFLALKELSIRSTHNDDRDGIRHIFFLLAPSLHVLIVAKINAFDGNVCMGEKIKYICSFADAARKKKWEEKTRGGETICWLFESIFPLNEWMA